MKLKRLLIALLMARIAARIGTSVAEISRINNFSGGELEEGLILQVPTGNSGAGRSKPQPQPLHARQQGGPPAVGLPVTSDRPRGSAAARADQVVDRAGVAATAAPGKVLKARLYRPAQPSDAAPAAGLSPAAALQSPATVRDVNINHTVVQGDTLYGLSRRHGVLPEEIRRANGIAGDEIRIGQRLIIPQSSE